MAKFSDVLRIVNGRNQRAVENPDGKYPIYGSGGIMGYADDFICKPYTVVLGRKGEYGAQSAAIEYDTTRPRYVRITDINDDGSLNDDYVSSSNMQDDDG